MSPRQTVTAVTEDYLKALWSAETRGVGMSVNELAKKMGVVASTASENVARLKNQGLVEHQPYRQVHLSERGRSVAVGMIRRHRLLETYLHEKLGFEWDEVHQEAEALEHAVSDRLLARLDQALGFPRRDPHGDPIPHEDGSWYAPQTRPLASLTVGESAAVGRISDRSSEILRDLEKSGILLDVRLSVRRIDKDGGMELLVEAPLPHSDGSGPEMTTEESRDSAPTETKENGYILHLSAKHVPVVEVVDERSLNVRG